MKTVKIAHAHNFKPEIPAIGFGCMSISEYYGNSDQEVAYKALQIALENGITHFDTANIYAFGENEVFLGNALNLKDPQIRKKLIIASKAGVVRDINNPNFLDVNIKPEYLRKQLTLSLNNLQVSYLDIFYIHRLLPQATDKELESLANFLLSVKNEGLIRAIGLSEPSLDQLKKIHKISPVSFIQSEYSLLERSIEQTGVLDFCRDNSITFVAYSPLCRGLLADDFDPKCLDANDFRFYVPKFNEENYQANLKIINQLKDFANKRNTSLSSLSLAWLIAKNVIPIPGIRKPDKALDAIKAINITLTEKDVSELDKIAYIGAPSGTRYPSAIMEMFNH